MSLFEIFGLYLVLYLLLLLVLVFGVIRLRLGGKVSLGDGGRTDLMAASRAHGNFVENAPFVLIGMISMMQLGTSALMLHVVGATFLVARILHAFGITRENSAHIARRIGMTLTLLVYILLVIYLGVLILQSRGSYGIS